MKPVLTKKEKSADKKSTAYIKYERLLSEIERLQHFKANITEAIHKAQAKINGEFSPLEMLVNSLNRDYLIRLDELATEIGIGKYNREWFVSYMSEELDMLLSIFGHQDKILSNLYKKYSGLSVKDMAKGNDMQEIANTIKEKFGFTVNIEELLEKGTRAYFEENSAHLGQDFSSDDDLFSKKNGKDGINDNKKKVSKAKLVQGDEILVKDARNIYMRLIKKFHPDLEKDEALREEKTEIVKQVTKAYQENDFFGLLKLQITYLEDNEAEATKIADDMIKRYNKILQKQLDEINTHLYQLRVAGGSIFDDLIDKNGKFSTQKFNARKRAVEKAIAQLKLILQDSKKRPKGWFKDQVNFIKETEHQKMMEDIFDGMFSDLKF